MSIKDEYKALQELKYEKRLKGYQRVEKSRYRLIFEGILSSAEFTQYCYYLDVLVDFDRSHTSTYGMFEVHTEVLAELFGLSERTIYRYNLKLEKLNLIQKVSSRKYLITGYKHIHKAYTQGYDFYETVKKFMNMKN